MKLTELDQKMRVFETSNDTRVLPGIFVVARLDGRNFSHLIHEIHSFEAPFDPKFRDMMIETTTYLMQCGFNITYGFTQSDEISLLFHHGENTFGRSQQKYSSILAAEASARFSLLLGDIATFNCRISQIPTQNLVVDYFRWRCEDARRNSINTYCHWLLLKEGQSAADVNLTLDSRSAAEKNELLIQNGIDYPKLPNWQKRGIGVTWEEQNVDEKIVRQLRVDMDLPPMDDYSLFLARLVQASR